MVPKEQIHGKAKIHAGIQDFGGQTGQGDEKVTSTNGIHLSEQSFILTLKSPVQVHHLSLSEYHS